MNIYCELASAPVPAAGRSPSRNDFHGGCPRGEQLLSRAFHWLSARALLRAWWPLARGKAGLSPWAVPRAGDMDRSGAWGPQTCTWPGQGALTEARDPFCGAGIGDPLCAGTRDPFHAKIGDPFCTGIGIHAVLGLGIYSVLSWG